MAKPWGRFAFIQAESLGAQKRDVFAQSAARIDKERAMRRCPLKILGRRLSELREMKQLSRDGLLMKLGAAREQPPLLWRLAALRVPRADEAVNPETFDRRLRQKKLREERRREGRYLLRTNLTGEDPARLYELYADYLRAVARHQEDRWTPSTSGGDSPP